MPLAIALSLIWILGLAAMFAAMQTTRLVSRAPLSPLLVIAVVALGARVVPILLLPEPPGVWALDIRSYHIVGDAVLAHRDVYAIDLGTPFAVYPYLPLQMYISAAVVWLTDHSSVSFFILACLPQICADAGTAILVCRAVERSRDDAEAGFRAGMLYAVCPLPILVSAYHGQFDAISIFFAFAALYCLVLADRSPRTLALSAVLLGVAILDKSWPVALLPVLVYHAGGWRDRVAYLATAVAVPAVATLAYIVMFPGEVGDLYERVTGYSAPYFDGQTLVLAHLSDVLPGVDQFLRWEVDHGFLVLTLALAATAVAVIPRVGAVTGCLAMVLAFLVATTSGGGNHQLWILPFAMLAARREFLLAWLATATLAELSTAFFACAIYCGFLDVSFGRQVAERLWTLAILEWVILVVWLGALIVGARRGVGPGRLSGPIPESGIVRRREQAIPIALHGLDWLVSRGHYAARFTSRQILRDSQKRRRA